jgi:LytS/YehU family sensor histidine kinase
LKERFGKSIEVQIDIPKDIDHCKIVPLSLQILLENAIKHNIISAKQPLKIKVFMDGDCTLIVRNNLQKKRQAMPSTKVGLENIKSRYAFFSEEKVVIQETKEFYSVRLPLIQMESNKLDQLTVN